MSTLFSCPVFLSLSLSLLRVVKSWIILFWFLLKCSFINHRPHFSAFVLQGVDPRPRFVNIFICVLFIVFKYSLIRFVCFFFKTVCFLPTRKEKVVSPYSSFTIVVPSIFLVIMIIFYHNYYYYYHPHFSCFLVISFQAFEFDIGLFLSQCDHHELTAIFFHCNIGIVSG